MITITAITVKSAKRDLSSSASTSASAYLGLSLGLSLGNEGGVA